MPRAALAELTRELLPAVRDTLQPTRCLPDRRTRDLSEREMEVLRALAAGSTTNRALALELGIRRSTVQTHLGNIQDKLGTTDRVGTVIEAFERGIVPLKREQVGLPDVPMVARPVPVRVPILNLDALADGQLSPRERDVVIVMTSGRPAQNEDIGGELKMSISTVKTHITSILAKCDALSRTQLVALAFRSGVPEKRQTPKPHPISLIGG